MMEYSSATTDCHPDLFGPNLAQVCHVSQFVLFLYYIEQYVRSSQSISGTCERVVPVKKPDDEYDFVVVGGGAEGSVVAARLSEFPEWKVLLLEAGPDEPASMQVPLFREPYLNSRVDWNYTSLNESYACLATNGSCRISAGKMLGGWTVLNRMLYSRGNPEDYDNWAKLGNEGWEWDKVKPYFLKSENNGEIERVGRFWHATGGPLPVERLPYLPPFGYSIMTAAAQAGYGISEDLNGAKLTGFSISQTTSRNGVRRSSARAFLWPARNRKNLHVSLDSQATKIVIENGKATGVEYYKNGKLQRVRATREVILSAGAIESPHLLLLSGIGPKEHLEANGIEVVHNLPGVGENLHNHVMLVIGFTINKTNTFENNWASIREYLETQTGPLSSFGLGSIMGTLASSAATSSNPDINIAFSGYDTACAPGTVGALRSSGRRPLTINAAYYHPKSRGRISLASNNPIDYPVIWLNSLSHTSDVERLVEAVQLALRLGETKAFRDNDFKLSETHLKQCSLHKYRSDAYWTCVAHQNQTTLPHLGGSCKMGPASDNMAVVNHRLQVHGIQRLRVADYSIVPQPLNSDTSAPKIMIGERATDFIKEDWGF